MTALPSDYAWMDDFFLGDAYCLAVIRDRGATEIIESLGGAERQSAIGIEGLAARADEEWNAELAGRPTMLAGFIETPTATLMMEHNGYLGTLDALMRPLSRGTTIVSHFTNVNALDRLTFWSDGVMVLDMEPLLANEAVPVPAHWRPQAIECGLRLEDTPAHGDEAADAEFLAHLASGVFAFAERLSGVPVTVSMVEGSMRTALIPLPADR